MVTREQRDAWNDAVLKLQVRAEDLTHPWAAYAETVFANLLKSNRNSIIYGRRGTGKTHLLKRVEQEYVDRFSDNKCVPIFVNGSYLRTESAIFGDSPQLVGLSLYVSFIRTLVAKLHKFIDARLDNSTWEQLKGILGADARSRAEQITSRLAKLLEKGEIRFLPTGEASEKMETIIQAAEKAKADFGVNLSDPARLGFKLPIDASAAGEITRHGIQVSQIQGQVILPVRNISSSISDLLSLMSNARLMVLFDEWSDLANNLEAQAFFADMLKRTVHMIGTSYVKLACIRNRAKLLTYIPPESAIPTGFELGSDIFSEVDLDKVVYTDNDVEQVSAFFVTLLKTHIGIKLDWVQDMDLKHFSEYLDTEVFENTVFRELCSASAAVPRDFIYLYQRA